MADFQGKYNGDQIEQLLDKANDIDLTKYALKTDNAPTATKLQAARIIALSGAVTGSVSSDFRSNVTIFTTLANFDASKIASGTISIDRLPKAALERLIVVADDTARFALTTATAQSGDTVKVTSTGKMYLIKDESKLNSEDGYEPYTASQASSVPWSGVTGKPSTFTPPTSSATVLGGIKVGYTTSGKNYKVQLDSSGNAYVNVPWTDTNTTYGVVGANGSTGLVKNGSTVTSASGYTACPIVGGIPYYKDTNTTYANMKAATASAAGAAGLVPAPAAGKQASFLRGDGTWVVPTNTTYGLASTTANGLLRQLNGSTSSFMRGDGTWATPPNTTYAVANESTNGLMAAADKKTMNRLIGVNTVTTLANLPISKRSITATLSAATTLSVQSGMQIGEELMIRCVPSAEENGLTLQLPANYTAAGKTTANGAVIADDPGAAGEFVWSITISDVPANVTIEELTATLKVTAAGGQTANVTVTQAAGDSTIELDKEIINLDVNGTQQTVNVTSNDSWTWAQAAARTVLRMMGR